jgi:tRNA threonylcarbamoyladenosine biosynthesis protein TsaB
MRMNDLPLFAVMDIIALETSAPEGSLALWRDSRPVSVERFRSDRAHNAVLFDPLAKVMAEAEPLECVVVGTGPGSYTGIRVGIATGLGLALARGVPLIGIPSVCALTHAMGEPSYAVCGDARRGVWWWCVVEHGRLTGEPIVGSADEIGALARAWPGHVYTPDAVSPPFCEATPSTAAAEILAMRALALTDEERGQLAACEVEPLYVSAPAISESKQPVFVAAKSPR